METTNFSRVAYRASQLWRAVWAKPRAVDHEQLRQYLSPAQLTLFLRMQPSEQAHAFSVWQRLKDMGHDHPDLLVAALLHDVGKSRQPLSVGERVLTVLAKAFFPKAAKRWGEGTPRGLRRAFAVAAQHPQWGAKMAAQAGVSPLAVELIREHQNTGADGASPLLRALQSVDDTH